MPIHLLGTSQEKKTFLEERREGREEGLVVAQPRIRFRSRSSTTPPKTSLGHREALISPFNKAHLLFPPASTAELGADTDLDAR